MKAQYYPDVSKANLFKEGYIAARSGHSRGSTIDLTIISFDPDSPGELDMGTNWDHLGPLSWAENISVTADQRSHRLLLQELMIKYGFLPIREEWWHFTLKDEPFPDTYFDFVVR